MIEHYALMLCKTRFHYPVLKPWSVSRKSSYSYIA